MERFSRWIRFNSWYFMHPPWDTGVTPPELEDFILTHRPGRALDLGCGTGANLLRLGKAGWEVTGVDFALRAVTKARARLRRAGCLGKVMVGDVTRLDGVAGEFDLILDIGCLHGLDAKGKQAYLGHVLRLLADQGTYLLYAHLRKSDSEGLGIDQAEIDRLAKTLVLIRREDSNDRWGRCATWLWFEHRSGKESYG